jgi:hypothetical protein
MSYKIYDNSARPMKHKKHGVQIHTSLCLPYFDVEHKL